MSEWGRERGVIGREGGRERVCVCVRERESEMKGKCDLHGGKGHKWMKTKRPCKS